MKSGDFLWLACLGGIAALMLVPETHNLFISSTKAHPYAMGFIKIAILATMGELLALRIVSGEWMRPVGLQWRFFVWGLFGISFALVFDVFGAGVTAAMTKGLLPGNGSLITAFWISAIMNLAFAPTFMALHRITDTYIDLSSGQLANLSRIQLRQVTAAIDWNGFVSFVVVKTVPLFWIPAHTVTFLLPPEYRVLMAAFLSIALGAILAFAKRKQVQ